MHTKFRDYNSDFDPWIQKFYPWILFVDPWTQQINPWLTSNTFSRQYHTTWLEQIHRHVYPIGLYHVARDK